MRIEFRRYSLFREMNAVSYSGLSYRFLKIKINYFSGEKHSLSIYISLLPIGKQLVGNNFRELCVKGTVSQERERAEIFNRFSVFLITSKRTL